MRAYGLIALVFLARLQLIRGIDVQNNNIAASYAGAAPRIAALHPFQLHGHLVELNATLKALANSNGDHVDALLKNATRSAWGAVQTAAKPLLALQKPAPSRRLQQAAVTSTATASAAKGGASAASGSEANLSALLERVINVPLGRGSGPPSPPKPASRRLQQTAIPSLADIQASAAALRAQTAAKAKELTEQAGQLAQVAENVAADAQALFGGALIGGSDPQAIAFTRVFLDRYNELQRQTLAQAMKQMPKRRRQRLLLQEGGESEAGGNGADIVYNNPNLLPATDAQRAADPLAAQDSDLAEGIANLGPASEAERAEYEYGADLGWGEPVYLEPMPMSMPMFDMGPAVMRQSVVVIVQPVDPDESVALLNEMLAFVRDVVSMSAAAATAPEQGYAPGQEASWLYGGGRWVDTGVPVDVEFAPEAEPAEYYLDGSDGESATLGEGSSALGGEELAPTKADTMAMAAAAAAAQSDRRRLMSSADPRTAASTAAYDFYDSDLDAALDDAYEQDEAWLWAQEPAEGRGEAVTKAAEVAAPGVKPEALSPELLQVLADPFGSSIADLLDLLAATPNGGEIRVEVAQRDPAMGHDLPRFAVFGPSALADAAYASGDSGAAAAAAAHADKKVAEVILVSTSTAARAPVRHELGGASPSGLDARWWGVALSLGAMGLLLVGASLATMKIRPTRGLGGEDDALLREARQAHIAAEGRSGREMPPPSPISAWESKMQHKVASKGKPGAEEAQRKTSNLPA